jgi:hypothetical protein
MDLRLPHSEMTLLLVFLFCYNIGHNIAFIKQDGIMPCGTAKPKKLTTTSCQRRLVSRHLDFATLFDVVIKMVLGITNVINLDHGFCLWIPAFAGMTKLLLFWL